MAHQLVLPRHLMIQVTQLATNMNIVLAIFAFIFGAIIGSFLNVVILRHGANLKKSRSFCFSCGHILKPLELVPVFSFLFLGGKCRHCKSKISWQYFWVELSFAIISVVLLFTSQDVNIYLWAFKYLTSLAFFGLLTCTFVYDLKHKIMPDGWTATAFILALIYTTVLGMGLKSALIGAFLVGIPLLLINLISRGRAMGMGDVKFAPVMGALLGVNVGFLALMLSFWIGGIVGIYLLISNKKITGKSQVPFGPFLVLSTLIVFVFNLNFDTMFIWLANILN